MKVTLFEELKRQSQRATTCSYIQSNDKLIKIDGHKANTDKSNVQVLHLDRIYIASEIKGMLKAFMAPNDILSTFTSKAVAGLAEFGLKGYKLPDNFDESKTLLIEHSALKLNKDDIRDTNEYYLNAISDSISSAISLVMFLNGITSATYIKSKEVLLDDHNHAKKFTIKSIAKNTESTIEFSELVPFTAHDIKNDLILCRLPRRSVLNSMIYNTEIGSVNFIKDSAYNFISSMAPGSQVLYINTDKVVANSYYDKMVVVRYSDTSISQILEPGVTKEDVLKEEIEKALSKTWDFVVLDSIDAVTSQMLNQKVYVCSNDLPENIVSIYGNRYEKQNELPKPDLFYSDGKYGYIYKCMDKYEASTSPLTIRFQHDKLNKRIPTQTIIQELSKEYMVMLTPNSIELVSAPKPTAGSDDDGDFEMRPLTKVNLKDSSIDVNIGKDENGKPKLAPISSLNIEIDSLAPLLNRYRSKLITLAINQDSKGNVILEYYNFSQNIFLRTIVGNMKTTDNGVEVLELIPSKCQILHQLSEILSTDTDNYDILENILDLLETISDGRYYTLDLHPGKFAQVITNIPLIITVF